MRGVNEGHGKVEERESGARCMEDGAHVAVGYQGGSIAKAGQCVVMDELLWQGSDTIRQACVLLSCENAGAR